MRPKKLLVNGYPIDLDEADGDVVACGGVFIGDRGIWVHRSGTLVTESGDHFVLTAMYDGEPIFIPMIRPVPKEWIDDYDDDPFHVIAMY